MRILLAVPVRLVVIGGALAAYYAALPVLFPGDDGGANIGAGLLAFAGLSLISFCWSVFDGRARGFAPAASIWAGTGALLAAGWLVALALAEADASMSVMDHVTGDLATVPFVAGLVVAPAIVGAIIGHALRPSA